MLRIRVLLYIFLVLVVIKNNLLAQSKIDLFFTYREDILKKVFAENFLYGEWKTLNLLRNDSITILDKTKMFDNLEELKMKDKTLVFKSENYSLPFSLETIAVTLKKKELEKYKCFFIINECRLKNNTIMLNLYKLITNHNIFIIYKINDKGRIKLIDYEISQY